MTARLCLCVLVLIIMTIISLQHPLPAKNYDASLLNHNDLKAFNYKEYVGGRHHVRIKRKADDNFLETQNINIPALENVNSKSKENDRNKRLEADESRAANQYYQPINEETKNVAPVISSNQVKGGIPDPKLKSIQSNPLKSGVKVRRSYENSDFVPDKLNRNFIYGEHKPNIDSAQFKGKENVKLQHQKESHSFRAEALETIKKINPLTIGNQVSQMIHERRCSSKSKPEFKSKCNRIIDSDSTELQKEDKADLQDREELPKFPAAFNKNQPSALMQKPGCSNDYGFSVIIVAGDPLKGLQASEGLQASDKKDNTKNDRKTFSEGGYGSNGHGSLSPDPSITGDGYARSLLGNDNVADEKRVEKHPNANVEFPVYDQDLTSDPDPFHGLLDKNYWVDPAIRSSNVLTPVGVRLVPCHRISAREVDKRYIRGKGRGKNNKNAYINVKGEGGKSKKANNYNYKVHAAIKGNGEKSRLRLNDDVDDKTVDKTEESVEEVTDQSVEEGINENVEEGINESVEEGTNENVEEGTNESKEEGTNENVEEGTNENVEEGTNENVEEGTDESSNEQTDEVSIEFDKNEHSPDGSSGDSENHNTDENGESESLDQKNLTNKTCKNCISWNDLTVYCNTETTAELTTVTDEETTIETTKVECPKGQSITDTDDKCWDCMSWKEKAKINSTET